MNIKSLLLGSAAALVAVSGARAADAVVIAEPEPMEYVRVCDTYGAGFYYIPGTETCIRLSGQIRYDIDYEGAGRPAADSYHFAGYDGETAQYVADTYEGDNGWRKNTIARFNVDVRSETEYGTFRRFIRFEGQANSNYLDENGSYYVGYDEFGTYGRSGSHNKVNLAYAYVELGGILVGYYDSLFDADLQIEADRTGNYDTVHQLRYTFNGGNGINAAMSLETYTYNETYVPNVVGNIGITQGWGGLQLWAAYDAGHDHGYDGAYYGGYDDDSWAVKAIGTWKATDALTIDAVAQYSSDNAGSSMYGTGFEWMIGASAIYQATDKLSLGVGAQGFFDRTGLDSDYYGYFDNDGDGWNVSGQIQYNIVENLLARLWVRYNSYDGAYKGFDNLGNEYFVDDYDFVDAKFRLEASF